MPLCVEEIGGLSVDEHLDLIGQLWNSLEREALTLTDAQQRELDRRLAALDGGTTQNWYETPVASRRRSSA